MRTILCRRRARSRPPRRTAGPDPDRRVIRELIGRALADDALADEVAELIFEHVVEDRYHPSVVAASLREILDRALAEATGEDWQAVADTLIGEARELEAGARRGAR